MDFYIFALYTAVSLFIGTLGIVMGIKKIDGAPLITVLAGFLFLIQIILITDITVGYTDERSILVSSIELAPQAGENITTTHYNVTTSSNFYGLRTGSTKFVGEEVTSSSSLLGDALNRVTLSLKKTGSPTGTAYIGVWDSTITPTNANYLFLVETLDVSTLTTSQTNYDFENTVSTYTLTSDDIVGIFYQGGDGSNRVDVYFIDPSAFDSSTSQLSHITTTVWNDQATQDIRGAIWSVIETEGMDAQTINTYDTVGNTPINEPFNQNDVWVFSIVLGLLFIFLGIAIQFARIQ